MPEQVIIIGSGPAGLTAGIYSSRANLQNILFEGFQSGGIPGGQLMITGIVENFPGFKEGISGQQLMAEMREQALRVGTKMIMEDIESVDLSSAPFKVVSSSGTYETLALIVATGATARRLPLDSEQRLWGRGISACAVCDGALPVFRNKPLAAIGGGDSAIEEAIHLTQFGSKVYLIHRRNEFRASKIMQKKAYSHPKIEIMWNKVVVEFVGDTFLKSLKLLDTVTGNLSMVEVAGAFEAIGHQPNIGFLKGQLPVDENGYIVTKPGSTETSVPGVFAAGDVRDSRFRQAITAAASGCMAALEVEWWLQGK
jgi:thioredoxin reductase (NADPH)